MSKSRMMFCKSHLHWPALAVAGLLCAQPASSAPRQGRAPARATPVGGTAEYKINPGDVIEIRVRNHTDLTRLITVRPDGRITFPRAGEVQAVGRASSDLAREIQRALERTLNNVRVEVEVKEAKPVVLQVRVIGAVKAPAGAAYKMSPGWRVLDAIAAAGGLSARPDRVEGRIVRPNGVRTFSVAAAVAQPGGASNIALQPDDLIVLDESRVPNQVSVTGQVTKPGAYDLADGLSLSSLLAQAGGVSSNAALRQARVVRAGVSIPLDLSGLNTPGGLNPAAASFRFQIGDQLVLPENLARYEVSGLVARPNFFPLPEREGEATLLKALAQAGGLSPEADGRAATITRRKDGQITTIPVDLEALVRGEVPDTVSLQADDRLFVPRRTAQVRAIGQVGKPGAFPLTENMSLMDLVSEAGVTPAGTGLSRAHVIRDGKQIPVDLYSVLVEGKSSDVVSGFKMQRDDVLIVPNITAQVSVTGQVAKPGLFELDDKLSLPSLIARAGNANPGAALNKSYVIRGEERIPLDLQSFLINGQADAATAAFRFQAGDVLVVPERASPGRFFVIGQVTRPGTYPYPEQASEATVFKALAQAGGPNSSGDGGADLSKAHIIRTINGQQTAIPVNLQNMLQANNGKGAQGVTTTSMVLLPEDALFIPTRKRGFKFSDVIGLLSPLAILR